MKSVLGFLGLLALACGQTTDVQQCIYQGGAASFPINTYIAGCTNPPCSFAQLTNVELQVIFRAPRRIQRMRTLAYAYLLGPIGAPYDLGDEAVTCNYLSNTYCPLQEDEVVEYNLRMFIESWMPAGTSVTIEFVIRDEADNSAVACIRTQIMITRPLTGRIDNSNSTMAIGDNE